MSHSLQYVSGSRKYFAPFFDPERKAVEFAARLRDGALILSDLSLRVRIRSKGSSVGVH